MHPGRLKSQNPKQSGFALVPVNQTRIQYNTSSRTGTLF